MVTILLSVLFHKAFHEIHGCHMFGLGQQVAGVAAAETRVCIHLIMITEHSSSTHRNNLCCLLLLSVSLFLRKAH